MIIVAGWARTGTTIMFQCLQESGFYGGEQKQLTGTPHKSEHSQWRVCNFFLMYYLGFQPIMTKDFTEQKLRVVDDFFTGLPDMHRKLPPHVWDKMRVCVNGIKKDRINILKDPQSAFAITEWIRFDEMFTNAKYIWCRRDPLEAAKSMVRLKLPRIKQYRGVLTTKKALKVYELHEAIWEKTLNNLLHIQVQLEHLVMEPETQAERISEFIGVPFDVSLVTEKQTYKGGNRVEFKSIDPFNPKEDLKRVEFA